LRRLERRTFIQYLMHQEISGVFWPNRTLRPGAGAALAISALAPQSHRMAIVTPPTAADTSAPILGPLSCRITPFAFCNWTPPAPAASAPPR
jgi:hypothetical protein